MNPMLTGGLGPRTIKVQRVTTSTVILLAVFTVACLIPFVNKAFHIDDTLFIWNARQILINPFDFYGFSANWYGTEMPMFQITKNPPLTSYYIAVVAALFGWSEIALHLAFLIPAISVVVGSYFLARRFCSQPVIAALAGMLTPVFLVSSTNIMCDTMMLAFWVWAVVLWMDGLEEDSPATLCFSAVIITLCALTKYFGLSLIPLLIVYSLFKKKRAGQWILFMLIPVVILAGYQWVTESLYGRGLLLDAAAYADNIRFKEGARTLEKGLTGLAFAGGSIAVIFFYLPLLWSKRAQLAVIVVTVISVVLFPELNLLNRFSFLHGEEIDWGRVIQLVVFVLVGMNLLVVALLDLWRNKDADSMLLFLWVFGTFIFASFINWSVNGRSILPMIPAAAILIVRRIEHRGLFFEGKNTLLPLIPLVPAALFALFVTWGDYDLSDSARKAAAEINDRYENIANTRWFQGHWGFQYYMELGGAKPIDTRQLWFSQGDIMVIPLNNTNIVPFNKRYFQLIQTVNLPLSSWLTTMNSTMGAGFYADVWGPLPFTIGSVPSEKYLVYSVRVPE